MRSTTQDQIDAIAVEVVDLIKPNEETLRIIVEVATHKRKMIAHQEQKGAT